MTAIGVFDNHANAQRAVNELRQAGFLETDIGVASRDGQTMQGATDTGDKASKTAVAATAGAATGAGMGALWGLGIAAGILPGIGPVIAGGTLAAILASAVTGAAAAGIAGALVGLGIPEAEAAHYDSEFQSGRTIVSVKAPANRYAQAIEILDRAGATANKF